MGQVPDSRAAPLAALVGEWTMRPQAEWMPEHAPGARVVFEWMPGELFLVQRWEVPVDVAPDGLAVLGWDEGRGTYLQHYFDSRGVARVYEMTLSDRVWTLERTKPDFSELGFWQRFRGEFSEDGRTITGAWEMSHDEGATWELDFEVRYDRDPR
jgi:hypothetical protein